MEGLGINWKILIGQIINFAILFFLLKKFVFGRFASTLKRRQDKIEDGLKKSEEAKQNLVKIRSLEKEVREKCDQNAREMMELAKANAEARGQEILSLAEQEKGKILFDAKQKIERELQEGKEKQRKETIDMSFLLAEKFLKEKFNAEKDKKLLEDLASEIK